MFCRRWYLSISPLISLSTAERSVHPDVRGALGGRGELRVPAHGSDADVSQLTDVYGLMARQDTQTHH